MATMPSCFYCGAITFYVPDMTVAKPWTHTKDHVFSKSLRKKGVSSITVHCCFNCNQKKASTRPGDFIKEKVDPSRWSVIDWKLIQARGKSGKVTGWMYKEEEMAHRFSNSKAIREDILRRVEKPRQYITAKLPVDLYYSLINDIQRAIQKTLQEAR
jgi:hypothetical protein